MDRVARRAVVYGATGRAGQQVAEALATRSAQLVVAGRDPSRLASLAARLGCEHAVAALDDHRSLVGLAGRGSVLINCAGPFARTAVPVARACIDAGTHYLDLSGERAAIEALLELHPAAARAGVVACPGAGAKGALGSWAAGLGLASAHARASARIDVAYAHAGDAYWRPTAGALRSVAGEGLRWEAARPLDHGPPPRTFSFPPPFGAGMAVQVSGIEEATLPRVGLSARARCYVAVDPGAPGNIPWGLLHHPWLAGVTRPVAPRLWRAMLEVSEPRLAAALPPPRSGAMAVVIERGLDRIAAVTRDGYTATVGTLAVCLQRLWSPPQPARGVCSVLDLVEPHDALRWLVRHGFASILRGDRTR